MISLAIKAVLAWAGEALGWRAILAGLGALALAFALAFALWWAVSALQNAAVQAERARVERAVQDGLRKVRPVVRNAQACNDAGREWDQTKGECKDAP